MQSARRSSGSNLPLWLAVLALGAQFVVVLFHNERPLATNERYYSAKAQHVAETGSLPRAQRREKDIEAGHLYGATDWRPPGYPVLLSVIGAGAFEDPRLLRVRVLTVQFALLAAVVMLLLHLLGRDAPNARARWGAALVLTVSPWTFEYAAAVLPDTIAAVLVTIALLAAGRWAAGRGGVPTLFAAVLAGSLPLLLRPELLALAPLLVLLAFAVGRRFRVRDLAAALVAFALVAGAQVAYRAWFIGKPGLYGAFRTTHAGAVDWTRTWLGTEQEAFGIIDALHDSKPVAVPPRAYGDAAERRTIELAIVQAVRSGYGRSVDEAFASVAEKRRKERPGLVLAVRAANPVQLWIHASLSPELERAIARLPRPVQRPMRIALVVLRLAVLVLALAGAVRAFLRWKRRTFDAADVLTLLMASWVVLATITVGVALDWRMHRLVQSAWLPLLWCAATAFRPPSSARETPART